VTQAKEADGGMHLLKVGHIATDEAIFKPIFLEHYENLNWNLCLEKKHLKTYYSILTKVICTVINVQNANNFRNGVVAQQSNFCCFLQPIKASVEIYYGEQGLVTKEKMLGYILRVLDGVIGALDGVQYFELAKDELGLVEENSILLDAVNHLQSSPKILRSL
jgi:hypothetical protein